MKKILHHAILALMLFLLPTVTFCQIDIGAASNFVIYTSGGAVHDNASAHSNLTGDVGYYTSGDFLGFGNVNGVMRPGVTLQTIACELALQSAVAQINSTTNDYFPGLLLGNGVVFTPGVYSIPGNATLNLDLVLDAQNVPNSEFIIKVNGTFSTSAAANVKLINGAQACKVFWLIQGQVDIATNTTMRGTIIANNAAINMATLDSLEGRLLSTTGAITIDGITAYTPQGCGSPVLTGPAFPNLGSIACYSIFSSNGALANTIGSSTAIGDVGNNGIGAISGWTPAAVTGMLHLIQDPSTIQAATDLSNLYSTLNAMVPDIELLYPAQFGNNLVLTPHVYIMLSAATFTDSLTLDAQGNPDGVFVIKISGGSPALTTSTYSKVKLINGAQAKNVFWLIDGAVNINNYSIFNGNIVVPNGAINLLNTGVVVNGRALAMVGAITTQGLAITMPPGCCVTTFTNNPQSICSGDSLFVAGAWQTLSGIYTDSLTTTLGCDSIIITNLTVKPANITINPQSLCSGDSLFVADAWQTLSGIYTDSLTTIQGCDSIIITQLTVNPANITINPQSLCSGDSLFVAGAWQTLSGIYTDSLTTTHGCDSVIITNLTVKPANITMNPQSICPGESYTFNGNTYTIAGNYNDTLTSINGCDSIIVTQLTINSAPVVITQPVNQTICEGDSVSFVVVATGSGLTYQWRKGTIDLMNGGNISGVTTDTLTINPATISDIATNYNVVISGICIGDTSTNNLASAGDFGILAGTDITSTGFSEIHDLDVGLSPGFHANITGFPPAIVVNGAIYASDDIFPPGIAAILIQAKQDLTDAYLYAEGASAPAPATISGDQGGTTLTPGIYKSTSSLLIQSGDLTLDAQGDENAKWIFQIASGLTTIGGAGGNVILTGNAKANNITWQVGSSAVIGNGTAFKGNILALTSITMNTGSTIDGRLLARNGAVTLSGANIINAPSVATAAIVSQSISVNVSLTVNPIPAVSSATTGAICSGVAQNYFITSTVTGTTFNWSRAAVAGITNIAISGQTNNPITEILTNTTNLPVNVIYLITPSANTCMGNTFTYTVTVNPSPTVLITNPVAVCSPSTADLTLPAVTLGSTLGLTYTYWTDALATIAYLTPTNATAGTYYIMGTALSGCFDIEPVIVTVNPTPTLVISNPSALCSPSTADLTLPAVTLGSTLGLTYTYWTDALATIAYLTPTNATAGTYYIMGTTLSGCFDIEPVIVTVNASPTVLITNPAAVCSPAMVDLTAAAITNGSTLGLTYTYWTDALATIAYLTPTNATVGTYYIMGTALSGCFDIEPVIVTVNPVYSTNNPQSICDGQTYFFNGNNYTLAGTYYDTLSSIGGCDSVIVTILTVNPLPIAVFSYTATSMLSYTFTNTSANATSYAWNFGDGHSSLIANPTNDYASAGTYTVMLIATNACGSDTMIQTIIIEPLVLDYEFFNGFSPNGDGYNDYWNIPILGYYTSNSVLILNRWGNEVWNGTNYNNTTVIWTGKNMNGDDLPDGTYYYVINYNNIDKRGWVFIKR